MQAPVTRDQELTHLLREPEGDPRGALVLLHGRGTSEADLHPLLDALDPERRLLGITPGGPLGGIPPGGRHWYVIEQVGRPEQSTFTETMGQLSEFTDGLLREHGVGWERTVVGGFSQGGAISLALAFGGGRPTPAGALAMSCFLPQVSGWPIDLESKREVPAYLSHGTYDDIIPVAFGHRSRDLLEGGGLDVTFRETPVGHQIDPRLLPEMQEWVRARTSGTDAEGG